MSLQLHRCELLLSDTPFKWREYLRWLSDTDLLAAHKATVAYAIEQRSDADVERLELLIRDTMAARFEALVHRCETQRIELDKATVQSATGPLHELARTICHAVEQRSDDCDMEMHARVCGAIRRWEEAMP